jgi:hypothetical protein
MRKLMVVHPSLPGQAGILRSFSGHDPDCLREWSFQGKSPKCAVRREQPSFDTVLTVVSSLGRKSSANVRGQPRVG